VVGLAARRAWVVVLATALSAAVAGYVAVLKPVSYTAKSVLIVKSGANSSGPGSANEAAALAATYAGLIPQDQGVLQALANTLKLDPTTVRQHLTVSVEGGTSLLDVSYTAGDSEAAVQGALAVASILTAKTQVTDVLPPGSLAAVHLASASTAKGSSSGKATMLGGALGLLMSLALVIIWERADLRVDDPAILSAAAGFPVWGTDELNPVMANALVTRWRELARWDPPRVAIVTVGGCTEADLEKVSGVLSAADHSVWSDKQPDNAPSLPPLRFETLRFSRGMFSGTDLALVDPSLTVMVVRHASRLREVMTAVDNLEALGLRPVWAFVIGAPTQHAPAPAALPATWPKRTTTRPANPRLATAGASTMSASRVIGQRRGNGPDRPRA